ncbi:unnamed protein product [Pieris macdunnoughi]|uniref:Uncharacterized protein n=1 Tax=Pieris macdunnoughi TaxID=345717 RepID=A0A821LXW2_9NEOP|nr:unnamed protein product [Pieris macdunnoughi]
MQLVGAITGGVRGGFGVWGAGVDVVEERRRLRSMKRGHASRTSRPQPTPQQCRFSSLTNDILKPSSFQPLSTSGCHKSIENFETL